MACINESSAPSSGATLEPVTKTTKSLIRKAPIEQDDEILLLNSPARKRRYFCLVPSFLVTLSARRYQLQYEKFSETETRLKTAEWCLKAKDVELACTRSTGSTLFENNSSLLARTEELLSSNSMLQSSNEELLSGNSTLQSSNEALLTGNSALQSSNSALSSSNSALHSSNSALSSSNSALHSSNGELLSGNSSLESALHARSKSAANAARMQQAQMKKKHRAQAKYQKQRKVIERQKTAGLRLQEEMMELREELHSAQGIADREFQARSALEASARQEKERTKQIEALQHSQICELGNELSERTSIRRARRAALLKSQSSPSSPETIMGDWKPLTPQSTEIELPDAPEVVEEVVEDQRMVDSAGANSASVNNGTQVQSGPGGAFASQSGKPTDLPMNSSNAHALSEDVEMTAPPPLAEVERGGKEPLRQTQHGSGGQVPSSPSFGQSHATQAVSPGGMVMSDVSSPSPMASGMETASLTASRHSGASSNSMLPKPDVVQGNSSAPSTTLSRGAGFASTSETRAQRDQRLKDDLMARRNIQNRSNSGPQSRSMPQGATTSMQPSGINNSAAHRPSPLRQVTVTSPSDSPAPAPSTTAPLPPSRLPGLSGQTVTSQPFSSQMTPPSLDFSTPVTNPRPLTPSSPSTPQVPNSPTSQSMGRTFQVGTSQARPGSFGVSNRGASSSQTGSGTARSPQSGSLSTPTVSPQAVANNTPPSPQSMGGAPQTWSIGTSQSRPGSFLSSNRGASASLTGSGITRSPQSGSLPTPTATPQAMANSPSVQPVAGSPQVFSIGTSQSRPGSFLPRNTGASTSQTGSGTARSKQPTGGSSSGSQTGSDTARASHSDGPANKKRRN